MNDGWMRLLVQGYTYKARMSNGAVFEAWSPMILPRREAARLLLAQANGSCEPAPYSQTTLESLWHTKGGK